MKVHERHLDADFLLAALKVVLLKHQKLKVVMMSATLDAHKFASYFSSTLSQGGSSPLKHNGPSGKAAVSELCPIVSIPGQTYPVQDFYLDDVSTLTGYLPRNLAIERAASKAAGSENQSEPSGTFSVPRGGFKMEEGADCGDDTDNGDEEDENDDEASTSTSTSTAAAAANGARYGETAKKAKAGRALGGAVDVNCALDYKLLVKVVTTSNILSLECERFNGVLFAWFIMPVTIDLFSCALLAPSWCAQWSIRTCKVTEGAS